ETGQPVGKLSGGFLMWSRIQVPAGFRRAVVYGPFGHVPVVQTAPDRKSSGYFSLVQLIFFCAIRSMYCWDRPKLLPPSPDAVWVPNSVTIIGILSAGRGKGARDRVAGGGGGEGE